MAFLQDITLGRYQYRDSFIHRLDPRTKAFCAIVLMTASFGVEGFQGLGGGIVIALLLIILSKIAFSDFSRNLRAFLWLFILTFALHILFTPASEKLTLPLTSWEISLAGVENGLFYSGRIVLLLAYSYWFMAVTSPLEIADGLERTLRPLKKIGFPAHETSMILSIALRFVPVLMDEARRIRDAQICRGARFDGNILQKAKSLSAMLIPLFASALRRADNLALALEARGYRCGEGRTSYVVLKFTAADLAAVGVITTLTVCLIIIN